MKHYSMLILLPVIILISLTACQRDLSPYTYTDKTAGSTSIIHQGTITGKQPVQLQGADRFQDNTTGIATGAIAGGMLGSLIGKGDGKTLGVLAGTAAGAFIGGKIEQEASKQMGMKYFIKLTNGQTISIIQGLQPPLEIGQEVTVEISQGGGRSRVYPR